MRMFIDFAPVLLAASTADADVVSTDQVSEAMRELVEGDSCKDVLGIAAVNENPLSATTEEFLDMLVLKGFVLGYASAKRQSPKDAMKELLDRCRLNLDEPFFGQASSGR
jgi:hypothetical protein